MSLPTLPAFMASRQRTENLKTGWECGICIEAWYAGERILVAHGENHDHGKSRAHCFHQACLGAWLSEQTSCPTCRLSLISAPIQSTQGQTESPDDWDLRAELLRKQWLTFYEFSLQVVECDTRFYVNRIAMQLRERMDLFLRGELDMSVEYEPILAGNDLDLGSDDDDMDIDDEDSSYESDDASEPLQYHLQSRALITALFGHWWSTFHEGDPDYPEMLQHPFSSVLLFEMFSALMSWENYKVSAATLGAMLRIRLSRGFDARYSTRDYMRPLGWEAYKEWLVFLATDFFNGIHAGDEIYGTAKNALKWVHEHDALFVRE